MNDSATSASGESLLPDTTTLFTTAHLTVIAIFAVVVILGLIWGARLKHRRKQAERTIEARNAEATQAPETPKPAARETTPVRTPAPAMTPPATTPPAATPPVAPPPPPLAPASVEPASFAPPGATPSNADAPVAAEPLADEPIAAATPLAAAPQVEAASAPDVATAADDPADRPVTLLKGLGPKVAARLGERGITRIGQLAALDDAAAARLDADLGAFSGRMARDRWIEQARFLAAGDTKGFEAVFGRL